MKKQSALETTEKLFNEAMELKARKHDYIVKARDLHFNENAEIVLPEDAQPNFFGTKVEIKPLPMNSDALGQACGKLSKYVFTDSKAGIPSKYLEAIPANLRADLLNEHVSRANGEEWRLRCFDDYARSVLSTRYKLFDNDEVMEILWEVAKAQGEGGWNARSFQTPNTLHYNVIFPTSIGDGNYGIGFHVSNGEIGNSRTRIEPLVQRHSCTNSIIRSGDGFSFTHTGDMASKRTIFKAQIAQVAPKAVAIIEDMIKAEEEAIPSFLDVVNGLAKQKGWTDKEKSTILQGTEGKETRAALVNGVTFAAHKLYAETENETEWNKLGGELLSVKGTVFDRARALVEIERNR